jgi:hypothetical protein
LDGERDRELTDPATGLQITMFPGELSLSVPYWYEGGEAGTIAELLRRVASSIEDETGLVAYDPQADAEFIDSMHDPAETFDRVNQLLPTITAAHRTEGDRPGRLGRLFRGNRDC